MLGFGICRVNFTRRGAFSKSQADRLAHAAVIQELIIVVCCALGQGNTKAYNACIIAEGRNGIVPGSRIANLCPVVLSFEACGIIGNHNEAVMATVVRRALA